MTVSSFSTFSPVETSKSHINNYDTSNILFLYTATQASSVDSNIGIIIIIGLSLLSCILCIVVTCVTVITIILIYKKRVRKSNHYDLR